MKNGTLDGFIEGLHQENEGRDLDRGLDDPLELPPNISINGKAKVMRNIQTREVEKDGKKLISVSVMFDLDGREIPMDNLENMSHEIDHWLTYLGMALWVLSKQNEVKGEKP